jgi:hypothetical protein
MKRIKLPQLDQEKLNGAWGGLKVLERCWAVWRTARGERALADTIRARPRKTASRRKCFILAHGEEEQCELRASVSCVLLLARFIQRASQWQRSKDENREIVEGRFCVRNSEGGITGGKYDCGAQL